MLELFRRMWVGWNVVVRGIVTAQSRLLMAVTWIVGLAPVALVMKAMGRRMLDRSPADPNAPSYRTTRDPKPLDMDRAARMF